MSLKAQLEAIVYATETPVTLEQIVPLVKDSMVAEQGAIEDAEIKSRVRAALETLAVIAYKQPATVPEISEIRGVDSGGVIATLLERKLITTAGRKAVIGRPILYKTTKEFLLRFGLKDVNELPSMEEFEKLVQESFQSEMLPADRSEPVAAESQAAHDGIESESTTAETAQEHEVAASEASIAPVDPQPEPESLETQTARQHEKSA